MTRAPARALPPIPEELPLSRDSLAYEVNAEPTVFAGGGRALLMQVAHPGVGHGVEQHSSYASDPWGRLFRTGDIMMKLSFGSPAVSRRQQRVLGAMHRRVSGTTDDGTAYSAMDADLQVWVWATLVQTAEMVHRRVRPALGRVEREHFYRESKLVAYGCGVPHGGCPETWDDFTAYVEGVVRDDLRVTDAARSVAVATLNPPLPGPLSKAAIAANRAVTLDLLPASLREAYGFGLTDADRRLAARFFAVGRAVSHVTPAVVRHLGAEITIRQRRPLRIPWLQQRGAEMTARALEAGGYAA